MEGYENLVNPQSTQKTINGWFISWKIPIQKWMMTGIYPPTPILWKPPGTSRISGPRTSHSTNTAHCPSLVSDVPKGKKTRRSVTPGEFMEMVDQQIIPNLSSYLVIYLVIYLSIYLSIYLIYTMSIYDTRLYPIIYSIR